MPRHRRAPQHRRACCEGSKWEESHSLDSCPTAKRSRDVACTREALLQALFFFLFFFCFFLICFFVVSFYHLSLVLFVAAFVCFFVYDFDYSLCIRVFFVLMLQTYHMVCTPITMATRSTTSRTEFMHSCADFFSHRSISFHYGSKTSSHTFVYTASTAQRSTASVRDIYIYNTHHSAALYA